MPYGSLAERQAAKVRAADLAEQHRETLYARVEELADTGASVDYIMRVTGFSRAEVTEMTARLPEPSREDLYSKPFVGTGRIPGTPAPKAAPVCSRGLGCTRPPDHRRSADGLCAFHGRSRDEAAAAQPAPTPKPAKAAAVPRQRAVSTPGRMPTPVPAPREQPARPAPRPVAPRPAPAPAPAHRVQSRAPKASGGSKPPPRVQTLTCADGHEWTRPPAGGRVPGRCPEHQAQRADLSRHTYRCPEGHDWNGPYTAGPSRRRCAEHPSPKRSWKGKVRPPRTFTCPEGEHQWVGQASNGKSRRRCPEHPPVSKRTTREYVCPVGRHPWTGPKYAGKTLRFCPEHKHVIELVCEVGDHTYTADRTPGKYAPRCPEHGGKRDRTRSFDVGDGARIHVRITGTVPDATWQAVVDALDTLAAAAVHGPAVTG